MDSLHRDYHPLPQLGPALSIHSTHWNPLTRSDFQLSFDDISLSPSYQLAQYLSQPPFLRISIAPPAPPSPMVTTSHGLLVLFGLSPSTPGSVARILAYLYNYDAVVSVSITALSHSDVVLTPLREYLHDGRYLHVTQPLPFSLSEAHWLLYHPLAPFRSLSPSPSYSPSSSTSSTASFAASPLGRTNPL